MVAVQGQLRQNVFEKDGEKKSTYIVRADRVEFIGPKVEKEEKLEDPQGFQAINEEVPF